MASALESRRATVAMQNQEGAIRNILVPTDFSPCSAQALKKALPLARQCGAAITLLYVVDVNAHIPNSGPAHADRVKVKLESEGRAHLGETVKELGDAQVEIRTLIQEGLPCEKICEVANECDLIVIGETRPKPFWRLFSRRTVDGLLAASPCPVVVVH